MNQKLTPLTPIEINIDNQELKFYPHFPKLKQVDIYQISTSKYGVGEKINSNQTPQGLMKIRAKIGDNNHPNTIFRARRSVKGILNSKDYQDLTQNDDLILSRIIWLSGLEPYYNRYREVDTMKRFIYIHGTPDSHFINQPSSIGCIRMKTKDVVDLFNKVQPYQHIYIRESSESKYDTLSLNSTEGSKIFENICIQIHGKLANKLQVEIYTNDNDNYPDFYLVVFNRQNQIVGSTLVVLNNQNLNIGKIVVNSKLASHEVIKEIIKKALTIAKNQGCYQININSKPKSKQHFKNLGFISQKNFFDKLGNPQIKMHLTIR